MDTSNPIGLNRKKHGTSVSELSGHFKLALINRFQHRLTFHEITREIYEEIMRDTYSKEVWLIKRLKPGAALEDELPDSVLKELCDESFDVRFGARPVRTAVCNYIDNKLLEGCA